MKLGTFALFLSSSLTSCVADSSSNKSLRNLQSCGELNTCYVVDLDKGTERPFDTKTPNYSLFEEARYSIRCELRSGSVDTMTFIYENGQTKTEYAEPYHMNGDIGTMALPVPFLVERCGFVIFSIKGMKENSECFNEEFVLFADCSSGYLPPNTCSASTTRCGYINGKPAFDLNRPSGFGPCETICRAGDELGALIASGEAQCGTCPSLCPPSLGCPKIVDNTGTTRQTYKVNIIFPDGYCYDRCFPSADLFGVLRDGRNKCGPCDEEELCSDQEPCNFNTDGMPFYQTHTLDEYGDCSSACTRGNAITPDDICGPCP